jgi:very-short-patch-repair endonuclease
MSDARVVEPDGADGAALAPAETPEETPETILRRATSLTEYLLAVRALMEKPSRTVPATDTFWHADLPDHPACELGPRELDQPSWLRVGRPSPPPAPRIPTGLLRHLVWDLSPSSSPTLVADADEELPEPVRAEFLAWYEQQWRPWSAEAAGAEATRALHEKLYDLRYRLDIDAARVELVWGHLVLDAEISGQARAAESGDVQRVHYPLVATPVAIGYDPETSTVTVTPEGPPRLQPDALAGLDDRRLADLLALGGPGGQLAIEPWDDADRRTLAERALRRLGLDPVIHSGRAAPPDGPHVHDTGVLFVRPRQRMVRRFLERMRERLLLASERSSAESSPRLASVAEASDAVGISADPTAVGALASVLAHEPSRLRMPGDDPEAWQRTTDRLLMPMATNDAQESIARRLAADRSVAVQGPPGTGKTHTIRNLICHLVAHGKRVLVLAQKEDPLRVLRDGLPAEIQPLCLAILGRSADQLVQLQIAARELSDRAATLDQPAEAVRVAELTDQLGAVESEIEQLRAELRVAAEAESASYQLDGRTVPAAVVGEWLRRHEPDDGFVPDPVGPGTDPPLTAAEFADLAELARRIPPADREAARGRLPDALPGAGASGGAGAEATGLARARALPTGEAIAAGRTALRDARKVVEALRDRGLVIDGVRRLGAEHVDELAAALRGAADDLARREGSWTDRLGRLVRDPNWQQVWDHHVASCQQLMAELARRTAFVAGRDLHVPEPHAGQPRRLVDQLAEIRARFAAGKKIGRLAGAELSKVAAGCLVDGEPLRTTGDVDLVVATVERDQLRRQLTNRWAEWGERLGLPAPGQGAEGRSGAALGVDHDVAELWSGQLLAEAIDALDWERRRWPALHATLAQVHPGSPRAVDTRQAGELAGAVEACGNVFLADRLEAQQRTMGDWLHELAADEAASPVTRELSVAWDAYDLPAWDAAVVEVGRLWTIQDDALRYGELRDRLVAVAPQWAASGEPFPAAGEAALRAWRWRQAQTWFDEAVGGVDPAALGRHLERCRERIRRLTHELVVASAWLEVSLTLDDRRKAALADWTAALRKIGKGTGKSAAHWQAAAQRAMAEAVTAVPVWIMSIDRALEQFQGGEPSGAAGRSEATAGGGSLFDVVIVDEASQADIFSLPVLSLARRAVVVGDDQQIGPQLVGAPTDRINALIRTHLADMPSAEHFDTESSLYDHAVRRSPQRILLTEHFRSVPPIIAFSSDTYYDRKIQPLRADRPVGLGAPVTAVPVPDGRRQSLPEYGQVNVAEAEALVARATAIVADPAYRGRSIGVVSLLSGSGQAAYLLHRLREQLGADELERRALRVGDAYTFQGDERDVVLISMVVASADGELGAFTKRDFHRRVNVAASRARDQLWLFHSVDLDDLHADDARALLLAHCRTPPPANDDAGPPEQRCETDFERAVLRRLTERGLRPTVQYRLGDYRIDFVFAAPDGRRLAIECDGTGYGGPDGFRRSLHRQAVLERVGNCVFVRLRASHFHRDPDAAMRPVWERVDELAIPMEQVVNP